MSSHSTARIPSAAGRLRQAQRVMRTEMLGCLHRAGFPDVTYAHIPIFRYQGPDGRQPTEIAATAQLSKQAVNDLLGQLQRSGYLKRKPHPDDGRARIVQLTARGRRLDAAIWEAGREVERTWKVRIGGPAWSVFRAVLDQIAEADPDAMSGDEAT